jgi:hypothetical protein
MALPSSGQISLSQVNVELSKSATAQIGMNDTNARTLAGKASGQISMSDFWGKSSFVTPTTFGTYDATWGGYYTGTQDGYYLFTDTTTVGRQWKTTGNTSAGTASTTNGYSNTYNQYNATHPAFQYAGGLSRAGFTDWFVGARCELQQQYNRRSCGSIPGYGTGFYWSSTENLASFAWLLSFCFGSWYCPGKATTHCVRPLRRTLI